MNKYISILRGINVSGKNKLKMASLKEALETLDFENIQTYIQSGNIVISTKGNLNSSQISNRIQALIANKFSLEVPVLTLTSLEIEEAVSGNPFLKEAGIDQQKLHLTFLEEQPSAEQLELIKNYDYLPDRFIISGKRVYVYCPNGYGRTKLNNTFFEKKLKVQATTRNWRTVNKLIELSSN